MGGEKESSAIGSLWRTANLREGGGAYLGAGGDDWFRSSCWLWENEPWAGKEVGRRLWPRTGFLLSRLFFGVIIGLPGFLSLFSYVPTKHKGSELFATRLRDIIGKLPDDFQELIKKWAVSKIFSYHGSYCDHYGNIARKITPQHCHCLVLEFSFINPFTVFESKSLNVSQKN